MKGGRLTIGTHRIDRGREPELRYVRSTAVCAVQSVAFGRLHIHRRPPSSAATA